MFIPACAGHLEDVQELVVADGDAEVFVDEDHDAWAYAHGRWWRRKPPPSKEVCSDITVNSCEESNVMS